MTFIRWAYFVSSITVDTKNQFNLSVISLFLYLRLTTMALDQVSGGDIFVQGFNTTHYGKRFAKYAGVILWNNLAPAMREIPSYKILKKQLQSSYLTCYCE